MAETVTAAFSQATLLYDGTCPMCQGIVQGLLFFQVTRGVLVFPWLEMAQKNPALQQSELAERVRHEILLILPETGEVLGGVSALAWILQQKKLLCWLGKLLQQPAGFAAAQWIYETVAMNRRILSPPKKPEIACSCNPPENPRLRWRFYAILLIISLSGLIAFSCALAVAYQTKALALIFHLLIAMAGGWLLAYLGLFLLLRQRFLEYVQQSLVVMMIGGLWLLVSAILLATVNLVFQDNFPRLASFVSVLSLNLHTAIMLLSTFRRSKALRFPVVLPWLWLALYFSGYLFTHKIDLALSLQTSCK